MKASLSTGKYPGVSALMIALLVAGCASTEPTRTESSANPIVGTWRLVSFEMEVQGTNGRIFPMGRAPSGYLSFLPDGRMAVVLTGEGRKAGTSEQERAALYSSLVAYTGGYRVDGDKWVTVVDASWNPAWVGTEQPRNFKLSGDTLQETSPWFPRPDKTNVRVFNTYSRLR